MVTYNVTFGDLWCPTMTRGYMWYLERTNTVSTYLDSFPHHQQVTEHARSVTSRLRHLSHLSPSARRRWVRPLRWLLWRRSYCCHRHTPAPETTDRRCNGVSGSVAAVQIPRQPRIQLHTHTLFTGLADEEPGLLLRLSRQLQAKSAQLN